MLIVLLWASYPAMAKLAMRDFPPFFMAVTRCVIASTFGVVLVITKGRFGLLRPEELHAGDLITLMSLCGWTAYTVYGTRLLGVHSPEVATTAAYTLGPLLLIPTAVVTAPLFPARDSARSSDGPWCCTRRSSAPSRTSGGIAR